jgi:hypothetical protein
MIFLISGIWENEDSFLEIEFPLSSFKIEGFIPKSMEIEGNCRESLQLLKWAYSLMKSYWLGHKRKNTVGIIYTFL